MRKQWLSVLVVGMAFGTAWAVRGQFGHEEGAAWAAAAGTMSLVLVSGRKDWYSKILLITLSAAIGWGAGGMISYGKVVGYGRSTEFTNAGYGLIMLFVIGGLYGLIGGGFAGLSLWSSDRNKVKWTSIIAEMAAGGVIFYYLFIVQFEFLMTPPRSEAWAVCMGAGLALLWHMARNKLQTPLRIAFISAMGAGFGFAFGNFLQITGNILQINFNMWNVMEYSIGFFGGTSMAYAVFTSEWPEETLSVQPWENISAWSIVFAFIPTVVFINSRFYEILASAGHSAQALNEITRAGAIVSLLVVIALIAITLARTIHKRNKFNRSDARVFFFLMFGTYIFLSYAVTGAFSGSFHLNHHLYIVNFGVILFLLSRKYPSFFPAGSRRLEIHGTRWLLYLGIIIVFIMLLAFFLVNMHGELNGAGSRFPNIL